MTLPPPMFPAASSAPTTTMPVVRPGRHRTGRILGAVALGVALLAASCSASAQRVVDENTQLDPGTTNSAQSLDRSEPSRTGAADTAETADGAETAGGVAGGNGSTEAARPASPPQELPRVLAAADIDCPAPDAMTSLTAGGQQMLARHLDAGGEVPTYQLVVDVDPTTGQLGAAMRADIPAGGDIANFRVFAGMDAFNSGLQVDAVTVNGEPVDAALDRALLTVPLPETGDDRATVELSFSFTIDQQAANDTSPFGALTGETLQPDQVGLLGRTDTGMQLGHWFPVWLPDGIRTDPDPSGFGDIGAFPAANICATITVPPSFDVITGGTRLATTETSIIEAGAGLRDFSMLISNGLTLLAGEAEGVDIRVWGPGDDPEALQTVLGFAEQSQQALTDAFGPYPWQEIDIVAAPLGSGVGGMEWPGAIWIEQNLFAGGLPGIGDLGDDEIFESILGSLGGAAFATTREWTIAHELGHEWFHATVGNDSIASPAVDEPLAQFAACVAMQEIHPDNWRTICEAQTIDQYAQSRALGVPDTAADQASDAFSSALQYGAVVYGKAPGFYLEAADLIGWDTLTMALGDFVADRSFDLVSTDALRQHLVDAAGQNGDEIDRLWNRWFRQANGDEDIEVSPGLGGLGGLDLEGLDLEGLALEGLDLEGLDLEDLEGLDLDDLLDSLGEADGE